MSKLFYMLTIADRSRLSDFIKAYRENGDPFSLVSLCHGTAGREVLDLLGLSGSERALIMSCVTPETWAGLKKAFERKLKIDIPGTGISFIIPMSSVCGKSGLELLTKGQTFSLGDEEELKGTKRELIVAICNQGCSDTVMDAARSAGAGGGTIIHAKGTGIEDSEKFLGFTLASEKDVILIVSGTGEKNNVMETIMKKAGTDSEAGTVVFSLPVTDTAGFRLTDADTEENEETA